MAFSLQDDARGCRRVSSQSNHPNEGEMVIESTTYAIKMQTILSRTIGTTINGKRNKLEKDASMRTA